MQATLETTVGEARTPGELRQGRVRWREEHFRVGPGWSGGTDVWYRVSGERIQKFDSIEVEYKGSTSELADKTIPLGRRERIFQQGHTNCVIHYAISDTYPYRELHFFLEGWKELKTVRERQKYEADKARNLDKKR